MNNMQRLDWFCRLRSLLKEPSVRIAIGTSRKKHLAMYDEALTDEINRLKKVCFGIEEGDGNDL